MSPPKVTFLGGVREIGGNKIIIEDGGDRVLFDFGQSFSSNYDDYYVNWLNPRSTSPVKDLLEFDLLPREPGLYAEDLLRGTPLKYEAPRVHAFFLSHPHMDHASYVNFLDPKIPVHVGAVTDTLLDVMETTGSFDRGDATWNIFQDRKKVKIGGIEVVPFPVDHSIPGAYGFLVHTSEGCIAYTGDFRQHGPRAPNTEAFLAAAAKEEPIAFISEGTRMGPDPRKNFTEDEVRVESEKVLKVSKQLALATCYPRDVDRLTSLYQAARAANREFIIPFKSAWLLKEMAGHKFPNVPVPGKAPGLHVYKRSKKTYYRWEREFLDGALPAKEVAKRGKKALLLIDFAQFTELIDIRPPKGSPFIHSMSEPFSEDDLEHEVLARWLDHFGLPYRQFHASGHCSGPELLEIVETVKPKTLFPIHTEHPENFKQSGVNVELPEIGKSYELSG